LCNIDLVIMSGCLLYSIHTACLTCVMSAVAGLLDLIGMFFDCDQEHFSESNGQTGYIEDRLKRVRRSLSADSQQRARKSSYKMLHPNRLMVSASYSQNCYYLHQRDYVIGRFVFLSVSSVTQKVEVGS